MIADEVKKELRNIMRYCSWKDLKIVELEMVPDVSQGTQSHTPAESMEAILSKAHQPSQILRKRRIRKSAIRRYLWGYSIPVTQEQSKIDYIRICLNMWQVKDDDFLWQFLTHDEIDTELDRFSENVQIRLQELKHRMKTKRPSLRELMEIKRAMNNMLLTLSSVGTESASLCSDAVVKPSTSSSEYDSDSSSSTSSVEVIHQFSKSSTPEPFPEPLFSDLSSPMHTEEASSPPVPLSESLDLSPSMHTDAAGPSSPQSSSAADTIGCSTSLLSSLMDHAVPTIPQPLTGMNTPNSSPTKTASSGQTTSKTTPSSRSPHRASCVTKRQISRTPLRRPSERIRETSVARERGRLFQTLLSTFWKLPWSPETSSST